MAERKHHDDRPGPRTSATRPLGRVRASEMKAGAGHVADRRSEPRTAGGATPSPPAGAFPATLSPPLSPSGRCVVVVVVVVLGVHHSGGDRASHGACSSATGRPAQADTRARATHRTPLSHATPQRGGEAELPERSGPWEELMATRLLVFFFVFSRERGTLSVHSVRVGLGLAGRGGRGGFPLGSQKEEGN